MLTTVREIQRYLRQTVAPNLVVDGDIGVNTAEAIELCLTRNAVGYEKWPRDRKLIAVEQTMFNTVKMKPHDFKLLKIDGLPGPDTLHGLEIWQNAIRDRMNVENDPDLKDATSSPPTRSGLIHNLWPLQKDCAAFYGSPGSNHATAKLPYPMRLAWDTNTLVTTMTVNKKLVDSVERIFSAVLNHYGSKKIQLLGLDLFGGCYNNRTMRGGNAVSMHAYAAAIDIDPDHNQLRWGRNLARMDENDYQPFIDIFEAEGWVSLGRARNYDWMHFQAARL